ncbi:MAG: RNA polymerase sigma factor [bacterium]|jgi:RNA polymerase sigma-70 factor, ECF subfamily
MPEDIQKIILEVKNGSHEAFRKVVERFQSYAYSLSFRILCQKQDAEDVVQEGFIKIWKHIGLYDHEQEFSTWMYKIITNTALDKLKREKRSHFTSLSEDHLVNRLKSDDDTAQKMVNSELGAIIHTLTGYLPEKQRMVFILRDMEELSSAETQEILDMSENSVKSNLYHARKSIKKQLELFMDKQKEV